MAENTTAKTSDTVGDKDIATIADKLAAAFSEKVNSDNIDASNQTSDTLKDYLEKSQNSNDDLADTIIEGFGSALDNSDLAANMNDITAIYKENKDIYSKNTESAERLNDSEHKEADYRGEIENTLKDISESQNDVLTSIQGLSLPDQESEKSLPDDSEEEDVSSEDTVDSPTFNESAVSDILENQSALMPQNVQVAVNLPENTDTESEPEADDNLSEIPLMMKGMMTSMDKQTSALNNISPDVTVNLSAPTELPDSTDDKEIPSKTDDETDAGEPDINKTEELPQPIDYSPKYDDISDSVKNVSSAISDLSSSIYDSEIDDTVNEPDTSPITVDENKQSSAVDISDTSIKNLASAMSDSVPDEKDQAENTADNADISSDATYDTSNSDVESKPSIPVPDLPDATTLSALIDTDMTSDDLNNQSDNKPVELTEENTETTENMAQPSPRKENQLPDQMSLRSTTDIDNDTDEETDENPENVERKSLEDTERTIPTNYNNVQMFQQASLSESDIKALADAIGKSVTDHLANSYELRAYDAQYLDAVADMTQRGKS